MGYLAAGRCWPHIWAARNAYFAQQAPEVGVTPGGDVVVVTVVQNDYYTEYGFGFDPTYMKITLNAATGEPVTGFYGYDVPSIELPTCDLTDYDLVAGLLFAFSVLFFVFATWFAQLLRVR